jgi:hypothetical protein
VKVADLTDNMRLERLGREPTEVDLERNKKYEAEKYFLKTTWSI